MQAWFNIKPTTIVHQYNRLNEKYIIIPANTEMVNII